MSKQRKVSRAERRQQKNRRRNLQLANIYSRIKGTTTDNKERAWLPNVWEAFSKEIAKDAVLRDLAEQKHEEHASEELSEQIELTGPFQKAEAKNIESRIYKPIHDQMTNDAKQDIPLSTSSQQIEPDVRGAQSILSQ